MTSQIDIIVIDEERLKQAVASKSVSILHEIAKSGAVAMDFGGQMTRLDLVLAIAGQSPCRRALKNILRGKTNRRPAPPFYVGAYRALCDHFALSAFQDWHSVSRAASWIHAIDEAAKRLKLRMNLPKLIYGPGAPIAVPQADPDEVNTGYWSNEDAKAVSHSIDTYFASDYFETENDPFRALGYPLHDVRNWVQAAAGRDNAAVVSFFY